MKRSTRSFADKVLRPRKRLFAHRFHFQDEMVHTQQNKIKLLDHCMKNDNNDDVQREKLILWESHKPKVKEKSIELGESKETSRVKKYEIVYTRKRKRSLKLDGFGEIYGSNDKVYKRRKKKVRVSLVSGFDGKCVFKKGCIVFADSSRGYGSEDDNHDDDDSSSRIKQFGCVYKRKRKRSLKLNTFNENHGLDDKINDKRVRISLGLGSDGKCVLKKGYIVFAASQGYGSEDGSSCVYWCSCFVSSVLRYLRMAKLFSWRQFSSFLLQEPDSSIYSSFGSRSHQDSTCTTTHGLFKVFGSIRSIPLFTLNINSLPFCFLYIHSNLHLKHLFLSYLSINHPTTKNATYNDLKLPTVGTLRRSSPLDKVVVPKKARSAIKRVPRVSLYDNLSETNVLIHVESIVPVPGVTEIVGYAEDDYVPFSLPESYISSRGDEVSRTLEKSYAPYDMDSDDEQWLRMFNHGCVSEDVFEKVIGAFERGIYCSPHDYTESASAIDRCLELASKDILEDVYSYWMTKRKKKLSPLIRVFQCYKQKRVRRRFTSVVLRKKRSFRRRVSRRFAQKQFEFKKAMLNDEKLLEESTKVYIKVHEAQEVAKRSKEASIVKRKQAQALMQAADLAVYRATMALSIAEARSAGGSADLVTGATLGSVVE